MNSKQNAAGWMSGNASKNNKCHDSIYATWTLTLLSVWVSDFRYVIMYENRVLQFSISCQTYTIIENSMQANGCCFLEILTQISFAIKAIIHELWYGIRRRKERIQNWWHNWLLLLSQLNYLLWLYELWLIRLHDNCTCIRV